MHDIKTRFAKPFTLLCLFVGAFARCPVILVNGRVWAEESNVYLLQNWRLPSLQILFAPRLGYYSFWANLWAMVAVRWVPLEVASYLFTGASLLVLLLVGCFLYEAEFLPTRGLKILGVATLLFTTGAIESWLNTINSQFYFALLAAVLLVSQSNRIAWQRAAALAVAVVSSPVAVLLTPFFIWRAITERKKTDWLQAGVMTLGSVVQVAVALLTKTGNRTLHFKPSELGPIVLNKSILFPLLGRPIATLAGRLMLRSPTMWVAAGWLLLGLCLACAWYLFRTSGPSRVLLASALWLSAGQTLLALGGGLLNGQPGFNERYALAPDCLLVLSLLAALAQPHTDKQRRWMRALLGFAFLAGFVDYLWLPLRVPSIFDAKPWHAQALQWERDETTPLQSDPDRWAPLRLSHQH